MNDKDLENVLKQMKAHDWYYMYSDDGKVSRKGKESETALFKVLRTVPLHELEVLLMQFDTKIQDFVLNNLRGVK